MSKRLIPIFAAIVALFSSCANDDEAVNGGKVELESGAICTIAPVEYVGDFSRTSLTLGSAGMDFHWDNDDKLSIFYSETDQTAGIYSLTENSISQEGTSAKFTAGGFTLQNGKRYYAISTTQDKAPIGVSIPDKRNIQLTYAGQKQTANGSTAHLGKYAYMAASGIAEGDDHVNLDFKHLGLTLRVIMNDLPRDAKFTRMEMYDTEDSYRQPVRMFNMETGLTENGSSWSYAPALQAPNTASASYKAAPRFSLQLGDPETGITPRNSDGRLDMFIELPPANLTGKDLVFMVYGKDNADKDIAYYITKPGRELVAGKAYQMMADAQVANTYYVKIKINHEWQLGTTLSRGTGDPGYDEKFTYPKNLYYILCVDGKVKAVGQEPVAVTEIENIADNQWSRSADNAVSTYAVPQAFSFTSDEMAQTRNIYVVASNNDLSDIFTHAEIQNGTSETVVRDLVYTIQAEEVSLDPQENTQAFMKNLYSTPWTTTNFVGNLGNDYFKDIILYHVAAKVDLKWNSTTSVMGNTEETNKVKVNNVQSTNLSLFQPATVNGTDGHTGTNNYTVTSIIEDDRKYYGRQVFYLPQMASADPNTSTYNVKVGNKSAEDVNFQPVTTGGFTSWMRWLRQY